MSSCNTAGGGCVKTKPSRCFPNRSLKRINSDVLTTCSARCGGMKMTPSSRPSTTSPAMTVAWPMRTGQFMPASMIVGDANVGW